MVTSSATVHRAVRRHRHVDRKSRKRLPNAQAAQNDDAGRDAGHAANQRDQHRFREQLPHNLHPARAEREAQRHFARAIGGARRK